MLASLQEIIVRGTDGDGPETGRIRTSQIEFLATAMRDEAKSSHDRIMKLLGLKAEISAHVKAERPRARLAVEIADELIAYPVLSVAEAQKRHGRSNQANRNAISVLADLGILQPLSERNYDRLFWCPRVFQILNG